MWNYKTSLLLCKKHFKIFAFFIIHNVPDLFEDSLNILAHTLFSLCQQHCFMIVHFLSHVWAQPWYDLYSANTMESSTIVVHPKDGGRKGHKVALRRVNWKGDEFDDYRKGEGG